MTSNFVIVDFETKSSADLKRLGAYKYAKHPSTQPLILAYKVNNKKAKVVSDDIEKECLMLYRKYFSKGYTFIAHNVNFDRYIFETVTGKTIDNYFCTALLSLSCSGPIKLEACGAFWNLTNEKDVTGKQLIRVFCVPVGLGWKFKKFMGLPLENRGGYYWNDEVFEKFKLYAKKDVLVCYDLYMKLREKENLIQKYKIDVNHRINAERNIKGLKFDLKKTNLMIRETETITKGLVARSKRLTKIKDFNINSTAQFLEFCNKKKKYIPNTQRDTIVQYLYKKDVPEKIKKLIKIKLAMPTNLHKKLHTINETNLKDIIRDNFICFGAGETGRYTSTGVNILNFPRNYLSKEEVKKDFKLLKKKGAYYKEYKEKSCDRMKSLFRPLIKAREGHYFLGGDFSQIEFRLLLLASGEYSSLRKLFKGHDFYKEFGKIIYGREVDDKERYVAKRGVLAFGYGLGVNTLISELQKEGIDLSLEKAQDLKKVYHDYFPQVKKYWNKVNKEFPHVKIPFSGRKLLYPYPSLAIPDKYSNSRSYRKSHGGRSWVHGASITGHVIQSLARDIFAYKERYLSSKGLSVVLPFHDEFVVETDSLSLTQFDTWLKKAPPWVKSENFPYLQCEVWKGKRYYK